MVAVIFEVTFIGQYLISKLEEFESNAAAGLSVSRNKRLHEFKLTAKPLLSISASSTLKKLMCGLFHSIV